MTHSRPRSSVCNQMTHYVITHLLNTYDYLTRETPTENPKKIAYYNSLSSADIFLSEKGDNSTTFSEEVYAATALAKKVPTHKCRFNLGPTNALVIYHPKDIKNVFSDNAKNLDTKESVNLFGHYFNKSRMPVIMALSLGNKHTEARRAFTSAVFEEKALGSLFPTIKQIAAKLTHRYKDHKTINLSEFASHFALRTILEGIIKAPNIEDKSIEQLARGVATGIDEAVTISSVAKLTLSQNLPFTLTGNADSTLQHVEKILFHDVIQKNKMAIEGNPASWLTQRVNEEKIQIIQNKKNQGLLSSCLSSHLTPDITSTDSTKETAFLITAGSDTTTNHIAHTFLAVLQDEKVLAEVSKEIMSLGKSPELMNRDDYMNLKFIKKVILESLRFFPPLPIQKTVVAKDFMTHDGIKITAGTHIYANIFEANRSFHAYLDDEKSYQPSDITAYYKNSDTFNPHRFDEFDEKTLHKFLEQFPADFKHQFTFQTFGKGLRMCPGRKAAILESTVALVDFFYYFNMTLVNDIKTLKLKTTFGMSAVSTVPDTPIQIAITARR